MPFNIRFYNAPIVSFQIHPFSFETHLILHLLLLILHLNHQNSVIKMDLVLQLLNQELFLLLLLQDLLLWQHLEYFHNFSLYFLQIFYYRNIMANVMRSFSGSKFHHHYYVLRHNLNHHLIIIYLFLYFVWPFHHTLFHLVHRSLLPNYRYRVPFLLHNLDLTCKFI